MSNSYYEAIIYLKNKVESYLNEIFKVYGNELLLRLEEFNLLSNSNNILESSTSIGFIMEEFISSKLEIYTKNHNSDTEIKIHRNSNNSTTNLSYDCFAEYKNIDFLMIIKVEKENSNNNAIAAINILYNDYVLKNPEKIKSYIILKIRYFFDNSKIDNQRKIFISGIDSYSLEEIDFSKGYKQDHRNWSKNFNANSGRLQITSKMRKENLLSINDISYERTKNFLVLIYKSNVKNS